MMMAADFGIPPWELEERAPAEWIDRWQADNQAMAEAEPKQFGNVPSISGGKRVTRVI